MGDSVYLDNNATTILDRTVAEAMRPYLDQLVGNSSSGHWLGRSARRAIDLARQQIAHAVHCNPAEIYFTSGATEANNLAIHSPAGRAGGHVLVNPAEHPSALEPAKHLTKRGFAVQELALDESGRVRDLASQVRDDTRLVIIQHANSETGCIQDIAALRQQLPPTCRFHCDAVQALGKVSIDFEGLGVTTMSFAAHKMHGPAGVGALIIRKDTSCQPLMLGGHQQSGIRPGSEPVALIAGFGAAVELAVRDLDKHAEQVASLRNYFEEQVRGRIEDVVINASIEDRLPNTSNVSFLGAKSDALVIALDLAGVCCSAGTACASGSMRPSAVLSAMGISGDRLQSAVRFSLSRFTTKKEVDLALDRLQTAVYQVRRSLSRT